MYNINCTVLYERDFSGGLFIVNVIIKRNKYEVTSFDVMRGKSYASIRECDRAVRETLEQNGIYVDKIDNNAGCYWSDIMYLSTDGCADTYFLHY